MNSWATCRSERQARRTREHPRAAPRPGRARPRMFPPVRGPACKAGGWKGGAPHPTHGEGPEPRAKRTGPRITRKGEQTHDRHQRNRRAGWPVMVNSRPKIRPGDPLTDKEREVLSLIAVGKTNRQIATAMTTDAKFIPEATVATWLHSAVTKLRADNRTHAVVLALIRKEIKVRGLPDDPAEYIHIGEVPG